MQDFLLQSTDVLSSRPKEMIVEIQLPKLDSAANLDLDVQVIIKVLGIGMVGETLGYLFN